MATLLSKGCFQFDERAALTGEQKGWLESDRPIDIIVKVLKKKLERTGKDNRLYFLLGRTGSGKSTLMISSLFEKLIRGSGGAIWCTEPRVVLAKSNPTDVIRYNRQYVFGKQMGSISGQEKIVCSERENMTYCTTQVFNNELLRIFDRPPEEAAKKIGKFRIVVIDEVHTIDRPMMQLLKTVRDCIEKFGNEEKCPLFIFSSATFDVAAMIKYYYLGATQEETSQNIARVFRDPLMTGLVTGKTNFPIEEYFLTNQELDKYNEQEYQQVQRNRNAGYRLMAEHFVNRYYRDLDRSPAKVKTPHGEVVCRDVLFFVPGVAGIEEIGTTLKEKIKDRPVYLIRKGQEFREVARWREGMKGKRRILYIPFASGYSPAGDALLESPLERDVDSLFNEIRIICATTTIDAGKTITTLRLAIDMGLVTGVIAQPLSQSIKLKLPYLRQIAANVNQTIQRVGRVGREAPGIFLHFYTRDVYKEFRQTEVPETVNTYSVSAMMMSHLKQKKVGQLFDLINENPWPYPTSVDTLLRTANDLICSGFLTPYGQLTELRVSMRYIDPWKLYARTLSAKGWSLFDSLMIAGINMRELPDVLCCESIAVEELTNRPKDWLDRLTTTDEERYWKVLMDVPIGVLDGIMQARNTMTEIMYGPDRSWAYDPNKIY